MKVFLITLSVICSLGLSPCALAQTSTSSPARATDRTGYSRPEQVPDVAAWQILLLWVSDCQTCPSRGTREGYLKGSGLTIDEVDVVIQAGNAYRLIQDDVVRRFKKSKASIPRPISKDTWAQITAPFDDLYPAVEKQRIFLQTELGPVGYQKLTDFVNTKTKSEIITSTEVK